MFKYKRKHFILVKSGNQNKLTNTPHKLKWAEPTVAQLEIIKLTERPGQQAALFTIGRQILTGMYQATEPQPEEPNSPMMAARHSSSL